MATVHQVRGSHSAELFAIQALYICIFNYFSTVLKYGDSDCNRRR